MYYKKHLNRREFMKGLVAIGGLLGIGAKVVAQEPEVPAFDEMAFEPVEPRDERRILEAFPGPATSHAMDALRYVSGLHRSEILVSEEWLNDACVSAHEYVERELARVIAAEMDKAFLFGG